MPRSFSLKRYSVRPNFLLVILGLLVGVAILSEVLQRASVHQGAESARLTSEKIADSVAVVSYFCDRISGQPDWEPAQAIRAEGTDTIALVDDVCAQVNPERTAIILNVSTPENINH